MKQKEKINFIFSQLEKLKDTLEFYSDESNYECRDGLDVWGEAEDSEVFLDSGRRARESLTDLTELSLMLNSKGKK